MAISKRKTKKTPRRFTVQYLVRFQHCDPAGIVFHPRYHEMLNQVIEDWFTQKLNWGFGRLIDNRGEGVPVAHVECDFMRPSRAGDMLTFELVVSKLGRTSITLNIHATEGREVRLRAVIVIVYSMIGAKVKPIPIPAKLRRAMQAYLQ